MRILRFIVQRLVQSFFVLVGLSVVIFIISRVVPGDPARMAVGYRASEEVAERMRNYMHLNDPLPTQYAYWVQGVLRGDFGESLITRRQVGLDIKKVFPATFELALFAGIIMTVGGITLGAIAAHNKDKWVDNVVRIFAYLGVVTPPFVFGVVFLLIFGFWLNWLPATGRLTQNITPPPTISGLITLDALLAGNFSLFVDAIKHLIMPGTALALAGVAQSARLTRATISGNLMKDYIAAERALGYSEKLILWRFLLKPSLIPTVSILGLDFAATIGNAFLVELIFYWPGISRYGVNAMLHKDLNAISAVVLVLGLVFILVNIAVDLIVGALDPRIRLSAQRSE